MFDNVVFFILIQSSANYVCLICTLLLQHDAIKYCSFNDTTTSIVFICLIQDRNILSSVSSAGLVVFSVFT